jgi:diacylglycerol O-acyltransferase
VASRLYSRLHLSNRHKPLFNLVITNVPGPQVPLYVGGARLITHIGLAPIFEGMGLILPIMSYAGTLAIGAVSDRAIAPDIEALAAGFEDELEALAASFQG